MLWSFALQLGVDGESISAAHGRHSSDDICGLKFPAIDLAVQLDLLLHCRIRSSTNMMAPQFLWLARIVDQMFCQVTLFVHARTGLQGPRAKLPPKARSNPAPYPLPHLQSMQGPSPTLLLPLLSTTECGPWQWASFPPNNENENAQWKT